MIAIIMMKKKEEWGEAGHGRGIGEEGRGRRKRRRRRRRMRIYVLAGKHILDQFAHLVATSGC